MEADNMQKTTCHIQNTKMFWCVALIVVPSDLYLGLFTKLIILPPTHPTTTMCPYQLLSQTYAVGSPLLN